MNATTQEVSPEQTALINELLEGEDPGSYVVISVEALSRQIQIALAEERRQCRCSSKCRQMNHGRLTYRILSNLKDLGWLAHLRPRR